MASSSPSTVFRVTGLPLDKAELDIKSKLFETIRDVLTEDEQQRVGMTVTCIPSCDGDQTSNALLEFKGGIPKFLLHLDRNPLGDWQVVMGDEDINIDRHFFGFTQLYPTAPGQPVTAEYGTSVDLCDSKANIRQHHRYNGPGRTRIWVMAGEGQRTNVAPRLPLERSAKLSNDDLWLQLQTVKSLR